MKKRLARMLRRTANRIDPQPATRLVQPTTTTSNYSATFYQRR